MKFFIRLTRQNRLLLFGFIIVALIPAAIFLARNPLKVAASSLLSFDEGFGTATNSSDGKSATITNATWQTEDMCVFGKCLYFNGTNAYAEINDTDGAYDASGDFTLMAWVRLTQDPTDYVNIVSKGDTDASYNYFLDVNANQEITAGFYGVDAVDPSTSTLTLNRWHHVAAVHDDSANTIYYYIDGRPAGTDDTSSITPTTNDGSLDIGAFESSVGNYSEFFPGFIDEVKIYTSTARTAAEIKAEYLQATPDRGATATFGGGDQSFLSDGLVGYWKMEEAGDATRTDSSGNSNTLTESTSDTIAQTSGKFGNAGDFERGDTEYLEIADASQKGLDLGNTFTMSAWINVESSSGNYEAIVGKATSGQWAYAWAVDGTGFRLMIDDDGWAGGGVEIGSGAVITTSQWDYFTITYDSFTIRLYKNGVEQNSGSFPYSTSITPFNGSSAFRLGNWDSQGEYYDGKLDEVRIYNQSLTASEVKALYDFAPGPVAHYKFDEGSGSSAYDSSGNNNTLTNQNSTPYTQGKYSTGANLSDSASNYFSASDNATLSLTGNMTVSGWIKPTSVTTDVHFPIAGKWDSTNQAYLLTQIGDEVRFYTESSSNYETTTATNLAVGNWYHVSAVYTAASQNVDIFVNGTLQTSSTTGTIPTSITDDASGFSIGGPLTATAVRTGSITTINNEYSSNTSVTVPSDAQIAVLSLAHWNSTANSDLTSANINSSNFTIIRQDSSDSGAGYTSIAYLANPSTGSQTLTWAFDDTRYEGAVMFLSFYKFVNTTDPIRSHGGQQQSDFDATTGSLTAQTGDIATAVAYNYGLGQDITWTNATEATQDDYNGLTGAFAEASPTGNVTITAGSVSDYLTISGMVIKADIQHYNGAIDDVRIYNYARTPDQIVADMNAGHPSPGSPVGSATAHWKFDEGYGTTAYDSGPNANNLTLSSASWTNSGKYDKAWNGTGALWLSRTDDDDFDLAAADDTTISIWFKSDSASNPGAIEYLFAKGPGSTTAGYAVYANTSGQMCFGIDDDTTWGPDDSACSTTDYYDGTWHHLVATKTGATRIDLAIDGKNVTSDTSIAATGTLANSSTLYVGDFNGTDNGNEWNGDLDEIKFYRQAFDTAQIAVEFNQGKAQVMGATGTDSTGAADNSAQRTYCPPGNTEGRCGSGDPSPVAHYTLDENTGSTVNDISGNGNSGTLSNSGWINAKYGSGIRASINNIQDAFTVTDPASGILDFSHTQSFTYSFWVKLTSTESGSYIQVFSKGYDGGPTNLGYGVDLISSTGEVYCNYVGGSDYDSASAAVAVVYDGNWHQITCVMDREPATDVHYLYVDGVLRASNSSLTQGTAVNASNLVIGEFGTSDEMANGGIDDIRIYNYARTPAQIAWDYNQGGPVGWWKLDENTGTSANDSMGNSTAGTLTNSPTWATGKLNTGVTFAGSNQHIIIADDPDFDFADDESMSIAIWFKHNTASTQEVILSKYAAAGYKIIMESDGDITCGLDYDATWTPTDSVTSTLATYDDDAWHHITCVKNGATSLSLYIDGVLIGSDASITATNTLTNADPLYLGIDADGTSNDFTGSLDDVRIYRYPLTQSQINLIMNEGSAVKFTQ